ncbi:MAG TPA: ATP-dependent zinc metalloprotease FtsH, partial [Actinomycetota bacterium]|nr:ATP-dependent zinc metalloprotease FtsH [Actinomycetota bacterium]
MSKQPAPKKPRSWDPRNAVPPKKKTTSGSSAPDQQRWVTAAWVVGALILILVFQSTLLGGGVQALPFSSKAASPPGFLQLVDKGAVTDANVSQTAVTGTYTSGSDTHKFSTTLPPNFQTNSLVRTLKANGVEVSASQPSVWSGFLFGWVLPILFFGAIYYFFILRRMRNQMGAGALSFGKNKAKLYDRTDMKTTFKDVAGVDEVEAELVELVDYLKTPKKFERLGARIPKGVLLVGPPGTGKTLLARAVAGEASVPFFYISASEFVELFVGLGAARVRDLFQQARERAPAIVFIDEIDSIGQARSGAAGNQLGAHQEQEQTLQQLLTEMDGFQPNSGVIIVAASNRPEVLDAALLRPGRFDRQIQVNLPDIKGREAILQIHARDVKMRGDVDLRVLARRTPGFSGAQLANVINEGALLAARRGKDEVDMMDLEEAIDRVYAGLERRSTVLSDKERTLVAYHELGHAIVARFVEHADPVHRVSIIPRGIGALGYTQQLAEEERFLMAEPELKDMIAILLGGRAAEELIFGFATTGAQDDLKRATETARRMVMEFGMSEKVGPINIAEQGPRYLSAVFRRGEEMSEEAQVVIDREVRAILVEALDKASAILTTRKQDMDELAVILLDKETLDANDLDAHFGKKQTPAPQLGP